MWESTARVGAALLVLAALSACVSAHQDAHYRAQREILSRTQASREIDPSSDEFGDLPELTRRALVSTVLERNPGLDAARAGWQAALARYPQEVALADPVFGYGVRPRSFSSSEVDPAQDFELSQFLSFPGKRGLRGEMALAAADAANEGVEAERVRLAALASQIFDAYWLADRALETNAAHQELLERFREVALARYASGVGAQQEVFAAETELAMLEHLEIELGAERRIAVERLNTLLHRAPTLRLPPPEHALALLPARELDADALALRALERRPEQRALMSRIQAREAAVALAEREFMPDFTLRGGYEGSMQETPLRPFVGIELSLPIQLDGRRAAVDEAKALLARERSRGHALGDRVRFEVTAAVERLQEAEHLLELSRARLLPAARDRVKSARAGVESGQVDFLALIDAERALRAAELGELEAEADRSRRSAQLSRALGEIAAIGEEAQ
jgi:cobalt-zinc-cadmium efflux system outer membrane protein